MLIRDRTARAKGLRASDELERAVRRFCAPLQARYALPLVLCPACRRACLLRPSSQARCALCLASYVRGARTRYELERAVVLERARDVDVDGERRSPVPDRYPVRNFPPPLAVPAAVLPTAPTPSPEPPESRSTEEL